MEVKIYHPSAQTAPLVQCEDVILKIVYKALVTVLLFFAAYLPHLLNTTNTLFL